jgi:hypothetical protein
MNPSTRNELARRAPAAVEAVTATFEPQSMARIDATMAGEVDIQVATAHRFPRSLSRVMSEACTMACATVEIAESCIYSLPRSGKAIAGPSVRLAEIIMSTWGNLRCQAQLVSEDHDSVTCRGTVWDLEKNVLIQSECRRSILDRNGNRYVPDMITMTINAASSIALRNAIFRAVPRVVVDAVYATARDCAVGDLKSIVERRGRALASLASMGVTADRVFNRLGITGAEEITLEHLEVLNGIRSALKEGDTILEDEFPEIKRPAKVEHPQDMPGKAPGLPQDTSEPPAPVQDPPETSETPLGPDGAQEEKRLRSMADAEGLDKAFNSLRAEAGLARDAAKWTASGAQKLEAAILSRAGGAK